MNPTNSVNPKDFYQKRMETFGASLSQAKKQRIWISLILILAFGALIAGIFACLKGDATFYELGFTIFSFLCFVWSTRMDTRFLNKIDHFKAQIECNRKELDYLNGNWDNLDTGKEYMDLNHPYTNDLDVFGETSLFQIINRTITPNGSVLMAETLKNPCLDKTGIENRQAATQELCNRVEWYQTFLTSSHSRPFTRTNDKMIQDWKKLDSFFKSGKTRQGLYFANSLMAGFVLAGIFIPRFLGLAVVLFLVQLLIAFLYSSRINKLQDKLGKFIQAAGNYFYLAKVIQGQHFQSELLAEIEADLFKGKNALQAFASLNNIQNGFEGRSNLLVVVLLDGFILNDLHLVLRLENWKNNYVNELDKWMSAIHRMEVLVSMANFRFNHPNFAVPRVAGETILDAKALGHPLLPAEQRITNDFATGGLHQLYIVTGANMAGKSTFLRTVGANLLLALTGNVVCAERFSFVPIQLFTSMRTTDNLAKGTSYFHAELLRLKALIDQVNTNQPHFIILDEMLKGTNSKDKLNGSIKFLNRLLGMPVSGLVATHDLALGKLSGENPDHFRNICFEIEHNDAEIYYDYKLREGVSQNMNASILMEQMGLI